MPSACPRCRTLLPFPAVAGPASGLCGACAGHEQRIRSGLSLDEYLDMFEHPVVVSDADGNVVAANAATAAPSGRPRAAVASVRLGDAIACTRSRHPGGCGKSIHCRDCTIRRMVAEVSRTRLARRRVPAYLETDEGRTELCITIRPGPGQLVEVILEDAPPAEA